MTAKEGTGLSDKDDSNEWFERQLAHAAALENQKHKPVKDKIEAELSVLRTQIMKMIEENQARLIFIFFFLKIIFTSRWSMSWNN